MCSRRVLIARCAPHARPRARRNRGQMSEGRCQMAVAPAEPSAPPTSDSGPRTRSSIPCQRHGLTPTGPARGRILSSSGPGRIFFLRPSGPFLLRPCGRVPSSHHPHPCQPPSAPWRLAGGGWWVRIAPAIVQPTIQDHSKSDHPTKTARGVRQAARAPRPTW